MKQIHYEGFVGKVLQPCQQGSGININLTRIHVSKFSKLTVLLPDLFVNASDKMIFEPNGRGFTPASDLSVSAYHKLSKSVEVKISLLQKRYCGYFSSITNGTGAPVPHTSIPQDTLTNYVVLPTYQHHPHRLHKLSLALASFSQLALPSTNRTLAQLLLESHLTVHSIQYSILLLVIHYYCSRFAVTAILFYSILKTIC